MTIYTIIFYVLGAEIIAATALAVTRRNMVHAVIYLIGSFFGSAMLFYLLGAPFLGALEVIVYAGAIMILFLFIVMMLKIDKSGAVIFPRTQLLAAIVLCAAFIVLFGVLIMGDPAGRTSLEMAMATPRTFGKYLFQQHWLAIEIVSLLLLVALLGAFLLGWMREEENGPRAQRGRKL